PMHAPMMPKMSTSQKRRGSRRDSFAESSISVSTAKALEPSSNKAHPLVCQPWRKLQLAADMGGSHKKSREEDKPRYRFLIIEKANGGTDKKQARSLFRRWWSGTTYPC